MKTFAEIIDSLPDDRKARIAARAGQLMKEELGMQHDFILLDRSGSMVTRWAEAINSVNNYVKELAAKNVDTGVTLAAFDSGPDGRLDFNIVRERIIPSTWRNVSPEEVYPRNGTPLNDATARLLDIAERGGYDKVAIIIMTDGEENSSREFSILSGGTAKIKARLDICRAKNWQVIFLGANFDNAAQAASYGNAAMFTSAVAAGNFTASTTTIASKRAVYGATGQSMSFTDEEKKKLAEKSQG